MKGWWSKFQDELSTLGAAIGNPDPSRNRAGAARLKWEEFSDAGGNRIGGAMMAPGKALWAGLKTPLGKGLGVGVGALAVGGFLAAQAYKKHERGEGVEHAMKAGAAGATFTAMRVLGGGSRGLATMMGGAAMAGVGVGLHSAMNIESMARAVLTGNPLNLKHGAGIVQGPLDAWFPFMKVLPGSDVRKFMMNPSIIKRAVGIGAVASMLAAPLEMLSPKAPPPTAYFDGRNMRRVGDMGADAGYGSAVMGKNSSLNGMSMDVIAQRLSHFV